MSEPDDLPTTSEGWSPPESWSPPPAASESWPPPESWSPPPATSESWPSPEQSPPENWTPPPATPASLLASDPRTTEPAWISLAMAPPAASNPPTPINPPLTPPTPPASPAPAPRPGSANETTAYQPAFGDTSTAATDAYESRADPYESRADAPSSAPFGQVVPPGPAPFGQSRFDPAPAGQGVPGSHSPGQTSAEPGTTGRVYGSPAVSSIDVDELDLGLELEPDDVSEPVPWDRRPLMIVLAAALALVLLGVLSGVASAALFGRPPPAGWRPAGGPNPSSSPPVAAPPVADTVTLSAVGDVIMGTLPGDLPPAGGDGFFDPVREVLAADLVMGNLETPLTEDTGRVKCRLITPPPQPGNPSPKPTREAGCFQLYLPPSYAKHLRDGGFHLMNLANNHTNDMGPDGLRHTRAALDAVGIKYTGAPNQITYVDVKGIKIAVIGFAIYSWSQSLNNIPAAQRLVRTAAAQADLVVIQMQGGAEGADKAHVQPGTETFLGENRGDLIKFSHAVVDAGADVVFGHGPHIMRGMEFYQGRLIAYSLGNFCGYGVLSTRGFLGVGGVLKVTLAKDGSWVGGQLTATEMVRGGLVAIDAQKRALAFVHGLSKDDFGAAAASISASDGAITPP